MVTAAEQVVPRTDLQGQVLPARLPATAAAFAAGAGQRAARRGHRPAAGRGGRGPAVARDAGRAWRQQLAAQAGDYTPTVLRDWGATLLDLLDQDGARTRRPRPARAATNCA